MGCSTHLVATTAIDNMMKVFLILTLGFVCVWNASGQNDGRYVPPTTRRRISSLASGRYAGAGDGRYRPSNDGRYSGGNDGKYVHVDVPGGAYTGGGGQYVPEKPKPIPTAPTPKRPPVDLTPKAIKPSVQGKGTGEGGGGWKIIRDENSVESDGYQYLWETENGILAEEQGKIQPLNSGDEALRSTGYYEYTGDDGLLYRVDYVADDNGFVPVGEHIPTQPPHVPKLLAYLAANAPSNRRRR
ncbi:larval cuticle protein LCP-30-like [Episyrphus balteatus]|uniref:larval cuticle protein LCP-30-like n=1 Tax=Episyrphus balteatus TaxID=286459 RepID=UPI0024853DF0|nr:larval cuticle protein LCP-30-like [Episyrphus balteatus]